MTRQLAHRISRPAVRFRLRSLLIAIATVAMFLIFAKSHLVPWYVERVQTNHVITAGGDVFKEPLENQLARQFVGDAISERATSVFLNNPTINDEWLDNVSDLTHIRVLGIRSKNVSNEGLRQLHRLRHLQVVYLTDTLVNEEGVDYLWRTFSQLRRVTVNGKVHLRPGGT